MTEFLVLTLEAGCSLAMLAGMVMAVAGVILGIILACTKRPHKWVEALVAGVVIPILALGLFLIAMTTWNMWGAWPG